MAVVKVFTPSGIKTVEMLGNVDEQDYDPVFVDEAAADQDTEAAEEEL